LILISIFFYRFKVVKIVSNEPFKKGRWVCMDYFDHTTTTSASSSGKDSQQGQGTMPPSNNPTTTGQAPQQPPPGEMINVMNNTLPPPTQQTQSMLNVHLNESQQQAPPQPQPVMPSPHPQSMMNLQQMLPIPQQTDNNNTLLAQHQESNVIVPNGLTNGDSSYSHVNQYGVHSNHIDTPSTYSSSILPPTSNIVNMVNSDIYSGAIPNN
jgi:hypothetical protein